MLSCAVFKKNTPRSVTLRYVTLLFLTATCAPSDSECDTGNNNKFLNKSGHDDEAEESE